MEQILRYIEEHMCEPLTNKQLAEAAGYSEWHFIRVFKEHMHVTPMEYVWRRRLIKASGDIADGERIIDAALKYGWQSHSAFTKSFHREFGFSPSLLRTMRIQLNCLGGSHMNDIFLKSTEIGMAKERLLEMLKESVKANGIDLDGIDLDEIYRVACKVYEGRKRYSGEEYVTHTINVAIILAEIGAESDVISAGMFCDAAIKGVVPLEELEKELPESVWSIVSNLPGENVNLMDLKDEVILIKLAERLHNMRTIEYMDDSKKRIKAKETFDVFMPLARKINNRKLIDELNDLVMKYYPENGKE
ncbi:MAG: HD domain-containing protein [Roseburia sp.]|nr:HD domain-containing protein [Roseburia sp.]